MTIDKHLADGLLGFARVMDWANNGNGRSGRWVVKNAMENCVNEIMAMERVDKK